MITVAELEAAIENANKCLLSVYPTYKEPDNINIKFTKAEGYWAKICRSVSINSSNEYNFNIQIGALFDKISDEKMRILRLEECMIHELIHTIPRCNNHGPNFKRIAQRINIKYPRYLIETQTATERYGLESTPIKKKYEIHCKDCGKIYYYGKKPRYDVSKYSCSKCGSDNLFLEKIY